jgi:hypothetical protein
LVAALMKNQLAARGLALASLIGVSALAALPWVGRYLPGTLINWGNRLVLSQAGDSEWGAVAVTAALIVLGVYGTWLIMRKKEL